MDIHNLSVLIFIHSHTQQIFTVYWAPGTALNTGDTRSMKNSLALRVGRGSRKRETGHEKNIQNSRKLRMCPPADQGIGDAGITWQKGLQKALKKENTDWKIENYSQGPEDEGRIASSGASEEARVEALGVCKCPAKELTFIPVHLKFMGIFENSTVCVWREWRGTCKIGINVPKNLNLNNIV